MIFPTFEEAKPQLDIARRSGAKIGAFLPAGGEFHPGYREVCRVLRERCSFMMGILPEHSRDSLDNEYQWFRMWNMPTADPFLAHVIIPMQMCEEVDGIADIVVRESQPLPRSPEEWSEMKRIAEDDFIPRYGRDLLEGTGRQFRADFLQDMMKAVVFISCYHFMKHWCPIHVFVNSYKEGMTRFIRKRIYEEMFGCEYHLIPPVRDEFGLAVSSTRLRQQHSPREEHCIDTLKSLAKGGAVITSPDETFGTLAARADSLGWFVREFERYRGPLTDDRLYLHVELIARDAAGIPNVTTIPHLDGYYPEGIYSDGFLFD